MGLLPSPPDDSVDLTQCNRAALCRRRRAICAAVVMADVATADLPALRRAGISGADAPRAGRRRDVGDAALLGATD